VPIREFFHLIHVVDDMDETNAWYYAMFAPQLFRPTGFAKQAKHLATP
jgi:hypothetical protein